MGQIQYPAPILGLMEVDPLSDIPEATQVVMGNESHISDFLSLRCHGLPPYSVAHKRFSNANDQLWCLA